MKKLSQKEKSELWSRLRKENDNFKDVCTERDKIVRLIENHEIVTKALYSELEKWDFKVDANFQKEIEQQEKDKAKRI